MEPLWNLTSNHPDHPAALAEVGGTLVEPCWNPGGTFVEPYLKPPRTTPQPLQNLLEPWWNPGRTLPQTTPQPSQNLVELWWNPGEPSWNLTSAPPRTTPEPIWAETPKLSADGKKLDLQRKTPVFLSANGSLPGNPPKASCLTASHAGIDLSPSSPPPALSPAPPAPRPGRPETTRAPGSAPGPPPKKKRAL